MNSIMTGSCKMPKKSYLQRLNHKHHLTETTDIVVQRVTLVSRCHFHFDIFYCLHACESPNLPGHTVVLCNETNSLQDMIRSMNRLVNTFSCDYTVNVLMCTSLCPYVYNYKPLCWILQCDCLLLLSECSAPTQDLQKVEYKTIPDWCIYCS